MADQYDQDLAAFLNGKVRVLADGLAGLKMALTIVKPLYIDNFQALVQGWADTDRILDGSENDGRLTLTVAEWKTVFTFIAALDADMAGATLSALIKASSNPRGLITE